MSVLLKIASFSLSISAVILLFYVVSRVTERRFSAVCRYLMWAFVVVRMCVPVSLLPSVINLPVTVGENAETAVVETVKAPAQPALPESVDLTHNSGPAETPPEAISDQTPVTPAIPANPAAPSEKDENIIQDPVAQKTDRPAEFQKHNNKLPGIPTLILISYVSVAAVLLLLRIIGYNLKMHALKRRFREPDERVVGMLLELGGFDMRTPDIAISPDVAGPFLFGFFRKTIVLPDVRLTDGELRGILMHELVHFRRGDLLMKLAGVVCLSFNFFNPLAYLAVSMMNREMELSCDETLLKGKNEIEREKYGRTLLKIVKMGTNVKAEKLTTEFYGSGKTMKRRFSAVMDAKKKKRGIVLISAALIVCILSGTLISCGVNNKKIGVNTGSQTEQQPTHGTDTEQTGDPENGSLTLNTDLLSEYKMTFAELTEKHGKIVDYTQFEGGNFYRFENGYGYYGFDIPANTSQLVTDPESGLEYMPVDDEALCRWIYRIEPDSLINGEFETLPIEELSNVDGLDYIGTNPDGIATAKAYCSMFHYQGWDNDKVTLDFYHDDKNIIDSTSEIRIYIHPQDIAEETKPKPLYDPEKDVLDYDTISKLADEDNRFLVAKAFLDGDGETIADCAGLWGSPSRGDSDELKKQYLNYYDDFFKSFTISDFECFEAELDQITGNILRLQEEGNCLVLKFNVTNSVSSIMPDGEHEFYVGFDSRYCGGEVDPKNPVHISDRDQELYDYKLLLEDIDPSLKSTFGHIMSFYDSFTSDFRTNEESMRKVPVYDLVYFLWKDLYEGGHYNGMPLEMVTQGAYELLGIKDLVVDQRFNSGASAVGLEKDETKFYRPPRGAFTPYYDVLSFENDNDLYRFTVRTYADESQFIVCDEFILTLKKSNGMYNYVFEDLEKTYSSGLQPGGFST